VPLLIYDTGEAPHFRIGYKMAAMFFALEIVLTVVIWYLANTWPMKKKAARESESPVGERDASTREALP
jgi:MFS transporter, ACS family, pantothenate transporter